MKASMASSIKGLCQAPLTARGMALPPRLGHLLAGLFNQRLGPGDHGLVRRIIIGGPNGPFLSQYQKEYSPTFQEPAP